LVWKVMVFPLRLSNQGTFMGDTGKWKHQGKKNLGWGGGRGQEARRSIAGIGQEKNPKASLRQEASRRSPGENPTV
jgi:hypothetical protein